MSLATTALNAVVASDMLVLLLVTALVSEIEIKVITSLHNSISAAGVVFEPATFRAQG